MLTPRGPLARPLTSAVPPSLVSCPPVDQGPVLCPLAMRCTGLQAFSSKGNGAGADGVETKGSGETSGKNRAVPTAAAAREAGSAERGGGASPHAAPTMQASRPRHIRPLHAQTFWSGIRWAPGHRYAESVGR